MYLREDSLAKPPLEPRYSGPYEVVEKRWNNNTFKIRISVRIEVVSLGRVRAAAIAS